jgi:nucleotide-binding universal stress UspA family protein
MPTTLVLGYDGSDCSKKALARTIDLAGAIADATVVVVYAFEFSIGYVPMGMTDSPLMMSAEFDDHAQLVRGYGEGQVDEAAGKLTAAGVKAEKVVAEGRPVEVLLDTAREHGAALIIVGSHGEGAVSAAFLGSTALKLLHHSALPVLVVPRHDKP